MRDSGARKRRKAERPKEILQAALETFAEHGFDGTRLDDVASRAGITKGTIYVYFPSKEDLFFAVLREKAAPVFENLARLLDEPKGTARDILRRHLDFVATHMLDDPCGRNIIRVLLAEGHRFPHLVDSWHSEVLGPALETIREILDYGVARGEFRPLDSACFPHLIMSPTIVCATWSGLFGEAHALDIRAMFDTAFDLFIHGMVAEPSVTPARKPQRRKT